MVHKGFSALISAGALVVGVASAQPVTATERAPEPMKVVFDSDGRIGVADGELLARIGLSPEEQHAARFDLQVPDGVPVSGEKQNMVCRIIPRK